MFERRLSDGRLNDTIMLSRCWQFGFMIIWKILEVSVYGLSAFIVRSPSLLAEFSAEYSNLPSIL